MNGDHRSIAGSAARMCWTISNGNCRKCVVPGRQDMRTSLAAMMDTGAAHQPTRFQSSNSTRWMDQATMHDRRAQCTMMTQRQVLAG
jgi:hypothetical protein